MERMLRPQGLFQNPWQQPWATPPANGGQPPSGGPTPPPPSGPYPGGGQYPAPPGPPSAYQTEALAQPGVGYPGSAPAPQPGQYPPGPYPPGAYPPGPGQYPPAPYGQGQYPGQYQGDQLAPAPYGPGGQYPPGGPYGPGGQFGPDGTPAGDQKRPLVLFGKVALPRSPLVPAIAIGALVIIAITAVVLSAGGGSGPSTGTAAGNATPTATASASATSGAEQLAAAKSLSGLLAQSGKDRVNVIDAVTNVDDCGGNLGQDAQIFRNDAANRRALLAKLQALPDRSALSAAMLADLTGGWQASATVDDDLARWADAAAKHCKGGDSHNPSLQASYNYDGIATQDKIHFTALWNPLARKDGLPTYQNTQI